MTTVHLLHPGYTGDRVGSSVVLVRDADALIIVDPGMVARRSLIPDPLAALDVAPEAVTHVFLSHHHPDHTINCALFPNAEVVDFWARYRDDLLARPRRRRVPAGAVRRSCGSRPGTPRRTRRSWSRPTTPCTR